MRLTHFARGCVSGVVIPLVMSLCFTITPKLFGTSPSGTSPKTVAAEQSERKRSYNLPQGDAATVLRQFATVSETSVLFMMEKVQGVQTNAIKGEYSTHEALKLMLAGTSLEFKWDDLTEGFVVGRLRSPDKNEVVGQEMDHQPQIKIKMRHTQIVAWLLAVLGSAAVPNMPAQTAASESSQMAASATGDANAKEEQVVKLPKFDVIGSPVDPYGASEASSAARIVSSILDTSMATYVITPAVIQDINPDALMNLTNYFAGVSLGRASGGVGGQNDRMNFRGFESFVRTIDNFAEMMMPYTNSPYNTFPTQFIDHVELTMGPDAVLSPTGTPGGTVNIFTKSPQFTPSTTLYGQVGNYNGNKVAVDVTGPLGDGKHMAYRVIADFQDAQTFQPGSFRESALAAEFTYAFSDKTKFMIKYFGDYQYRGGTCGMTGEEGEMVYTPDTVGGAVISTTPEPGFTYKGWNGVATWTQAEITRDNLVQAELTSALGEKINMRLAASILYNTYSNNRGFTNPTIKETWDVQTGQENSVTLVQPLTAMAEEGFYQYFSSRLIQIQNDYAGNFQAGGISLQPVAGWAYRGGEMPSYYAVFDRTTLPTANLYQQLYDPPMPPLSAYTTFGNNTPGNEATEQVYANLRAGFLNERLFVTVGAARTWAQANMYVIPYISRANGISAGNFAGAVADHTFSHTGNSQIPSEQPWHDAYVAGILYKVLPKVSVYYNFSTDNAVASLTPLWQTGVQNEFGVKSVLLNGRLSVSADHFEIKQNNVSFPNPAYGTGSPIVTLYSNLNSHGEELNIQGGITEDLSVIASYTNMRLRDPWGRRQRNIPDNFANVLLDYRFPKGALKGALKGSNVWVGVLHQADVAGETVQGFTSLQVPEQPGFYLPAFTIVNAGAGYQMGHLRYSLNVNNVFNTKAWFMAFSRASESPYPGTCVTLTVTAHL